MSETKKPEPLKISEEVRAKVMAGKRKADESFMGKVESVPVAPGGVEVDRYLPSLNGTAFNGMMKCVYDSEGNRLHYGPKFAPDSFAEFVIYEDHKAALRASRLALSERTKERDWLREGDKENRELISALRAPVVAWIELCNTSSMPFKPSSREGTRQTMNQLLVLIDAALSHPRAGEAG